MKKCPSRGRQILKPIKIPTLEAFLAFPPLTGSIEINERRSEAHLIKFIEYRSKNKFYFCSYCDKRTQQGDYFSTKSHMCICLKRRGRNSGPSTVNSLKLFLSDPFIDTQSTEAAIYTDEEKREKRNSKVDRRCSLLTQHFSLLQTQIKYLFASRFITMHGDMS